MRRSGKLLVILLSTAVLVGCAAAPDPVPTAAPPPQATCPDGLADALEAHLLTQPLGDRMPVEAAATELPESQTIAPQLVESLVGCVIQLESVYENGDRMGQIFGIADGLDEEGVIAAFEEAGWVQLFPDTDPGVWGPEDRSDGARISTPSSEPPAYGFGDWSEFLGPDEVILEGRI